jgi:hypothetical protein
LVLAAACSSAPDLEPPERGRGFQVREERFLVPGGRDAVYCMNYPMPADYGHGPQFVTGVESRLPALTHHFFMAYDETERSEAAPCLPGGPLTFGDVERAADPHGDNGKMLFISGEGEEAYFLPAGYGLYLPTGRGHMSTSHHVLNTTELDAQLDGVINIHTAPRDEIHHPVNILNCLLTDLHVPPKTRAAIGGTCLAPWALDLVVLGSHAHQHLDRFEMRFFDGERTGDAPFYVSADWDSPEIVTLDEPIHLEAGQGITFTCHYDNRTDHALEFGVGDFGEMCAIMSAYAYPADRPNEVPPSLGSLVYEEGITILLFDTTEIDGPF